MNIKNFEKCIDDKILQRGFKYFDEGHVESLAVEGGEWTAEVAGSEEYTVTVQLSKTGEILDTHCDCPYDWGEYCKHQAAVFYALREEWSKDSGKDKTSKETLEEIVGRQDHATLTSTLLEYAREDKLLRQDLLLRFSSEPFTAKQAKTIIKDSIRKVKRQGFVEWRDAFAATEGAWRVLEIIQERSGQIKPLEGVSICIAVLREMIDLLDYCDDSDGDVGNVISETIQGISDIADQIPEKHPEAGKVFDVIFAHAGDAMYDGWSDWRLDLLDACIPLCGTEPKRNKLEGYLVDLQRENQELSYTRNEAQKMIHRLTAKFDGAAAAQAYLESHLENSDFRKAAIGMAMEGNQLDHALKLCLDGEKLGADFAGLVSDWRQLRYAVYERQNNIAAQKKLAMQLAMDGSFEYFIRLKELYANEPEEWQAQLERILQVLHNGRWRYDTYVKILIHEKLKLKLLEFCSDNPASIVDLYPHLLPEHSESVNALFKEYILRQSAAATDRKNYKKVCAIIQKYHKACGKEDTGKIIGELLMSYPKRPAFVDELGKIKLA